MERRKWFVSTLTEWIVDRNPLCWLIPAGLCLKGGDIPLGSSINNVKWQHTQIICFWYEWSCNPWQQVFGNRLTHDSGMQMIQLLAPPSPRILMLNRARGQSRAVALPCDVLNDKQSVKRLRIWCEGNSMWKKRRWRKAEALQQCCRACASCGCGGYTGQPAVALLRNAPSFSSRCYWSLSWTNPAFILRTDQYSLTPVLRSQGPFARVATGKLAG